MSDSDPSYRPDCSSPDSESDFSSIDIDYDTEVQFDMGIADLIPPTQPSTSASYSPLTGSVPNRPITRSSNQTTQDKVIERRVKQLLANTVPAATLRSNKYALNAYSKFAKTDSTVPDDWTTIPIDRIPHALIRFTAARGIDYQPVTFYNIICGQYFS